MIHKEFAFTANIENLVLPPGCRPHTLQAESWSRSETIGYAVNKRSGKMEYWNFGLRLVELRAYGSERILVLVE